MGDPTGGLFSAANAAQSGADAANAASGGADPSGGLGGIDPTFGMGGSSWDPSAGGGMGTDFGSFTGAPIPGDPTGSAAAQQSITGAVPGSQPPISDQPASSRGLGQQQAPPPPPQPPPQPYKTASEALWGGPQLSGTPGGQQFAPLPTTNDASKFEAWAPQANTDLAKLASANMPLPPQPSQPFNYGGGGGIKLPPAPPPTSPVLPPVNPPDAFPAPQENVPTPQERPQTGQDMGTPPSVPTPQARPQTGQDLGVPATPPTTPSVGPPGGGGTQAGGGIPGGGGGPQSPLEQLVSQFLHMIMGGQGGLEQMLMRALGISPRQMFPQYFGGGFNPPPPTPGSGYFPAGTTGGQPRTPGTTPAPGGRTGSPPLPQPRPPRSPGTPPSASPPPSASGTEDIPRPPSEVGPSYDPSKYARGLIRIESGGNPNERTGKNTGLIQFGPEEYRKYMYDIPRSLWHTQRAQMIGLQRENQANTNLLRRTLGRNPTPAELYLTHQQGVGGGPALLKANPNTPAWQALRRIGVPERTAKMSIGNFFDGQRHSNAGNIPRNNPLYNTPVEQITAGQFINMWRDRFNRAMQ